MGALLLYVKSIRQDKKGNGAHRIRAPLGAPKSFRRAGSHDFGSDHRERLEEEPATLGDDPIRSSEALGGTSRASSSRRLYRGVSTSENTRNGTASNAFVRTNTKMSLSRGHFETFRGDPKTLRAELTSWTGSEIEGRETYRGRAGKYNLPNRIQTHTHDPQGGCKKKRQREERNEQARKRA